MEDNFLISKKPNKSYVPLNNKGCNASAPCPTRVEHVNEYGEKELTHTYCKNMFTDCKFPKSPGRGCLSLGNIGHEQCKEQRCHGGTCSTRIGDKWYVPIDGRCGNAGDDGLFKKETDPCEPDTKCTASGIYSVGNCKFG